MRGEKQIPSGVHGEQIFYSFHHDVVTHLLRQGVPVYKVGKIVGHSSEKITERYSHFIPDDLEDAMDLLG
nr:tyrosine-type recombinase/integrase [Salinibacter ruber]